MTTVVRSAPATLRLLVSILIYLVLRAQPWAAPVGVRIDEVSPAAAVAGGRVTLSGIGFLGARVTVGGVPATVLTSTANRVTFEVPRGVAPGAAPMALTNAAGRTATARFAVRDRMPIANAGPDQAVAVTTTVTLDGSRSIDPDGDPLTFVWAIVSKPPFSNATPLNPTAARTSFIVDLPGRYVARLIVLGPSMRAVLDALDPGWLARLVSGQPLAPRVLEALAERLQRGRGNQDGDERGNVNRNDRHRIVRGEHQLRQRVPDQQWGMRRQCDLCQHGRIAHLRVPAGAARRWADLPRMSGRLYESGPRDVCADRRAAA